MNGIVTLVAGVLLVGGTVMIARATTRTQAELYVVGALFGLVLYHASFGFTSAWRVFIVSRRGTGLRAQMAMLALAVALFFPVIANGSIFRLPVAGQVAPVGVSVVFGAFLFGIGMQVAGGCSSGTLYTAGGGSVRMVLTLVSLVIGSTIGAAHFAWWAALPHLPPISLVRAWGIGPALLANLAAFALIVLVSVVLERRRHGELLGWLNIPSMAPASGRSRLLRGPWPLLAGALSLAVLNFMTLLISGRPWGITFAFALWGSKAAALLGLDPAHWSMWATASGRAALNTTVLADTNTVMDFGIMVGALLAAALAGRYAPTWRFPPLSALAAVLGGLAMGYGARMAYGCNIGAYFSGIASGSLHGWVWIIAAYAGNKIGIGWRPAFGLAVERS